MGLTRFPLRYDTIGSYFDKTVERYPDNLALVSCEQGIRWTYKGLQERVDDFAKGLISLGFHPGERLGIWSPNNAEWVITQLATAKLGIILVNINPAYKASELMYVLQKVGCKGLVLKNQFKTSHYLEMLASCVPEIKSPRPLKSEAIPTLEVVIQIGDSQSPYPGVYQFEDIPAIASIENDLLLSQISESLSPDDAINIQFTSGTTGHPKGATLTHYNI
ncbi:MAG: AMP-binding protein, partial [Cyanobacteria bacterium]|nr:AMP-binding protein [Cyanobacteriota bacterium]